MQKFARTVFVEVLLARIVFVEALLVGFIFVEVLFVGAVFITVFFVKVLFSCNGFCHVYSFITRSLEDSLEERWLERNHR